MWFDQLGYPWPKHGCFDHKSYSAIHVSGKDFSDYLREAASLDFDSILAVVVNGSKRASTSGRLYTLLCADMKERGVMLPSLWSPQHFVGQFVLLTLSTEKLIVVETRQKVPCKVVSSRLISSGDLN
jgi:hypothetical protein